MVNYWNLVGVIKKLFYQRGAWELRSLSFSQKCIHTERIWPPARAAPCRRSRWRSKPPRCCRWSPAPPGGRWAAPSAPATPPNRDTQTAAGNRESIKTCPWSKHFRKFQTCWDTNRKGPKHRITSFQNENNKLNLFYKCRGRHNKTEEDREKANTGEKRGKTPGTEQ